MTVINNNVSRLSVSISQEVLRKFFAIYPSGTRSKVVENLLNENMHNRSNKFRHAADLIENDPRFSKVREDSFLWANADLISE
jgi:hypothetical protein